MPSSVIFLWMSTRSLRLDLVARMLRDRPGITTATLADELGVSQRSVFRDIEVLRERGFPIDASRGPGGGLRLHASWGLGRVLLSTEEGLGTLLSLAISEKVGMPMFTGGIARARRKIVDAFPERERRRIRPLRDRIVIGPAASPQVRDSYGNPASAPMRALEQAFVSEHLLRAKYVRQDGTQSDRRLEPHAMLINWPAWYLLAVDHLRGEPRTFRFDRFLAVQPLPDSFRAQPAVIARAVLDERAGPISVV
jgi:predicted DNA-binding transcriptional regulator YafY